MTPLPVSAGVRITRVTSIGSVRPRSSSQPLVALVTAGIASLFILRSRMRRRPTQRIVHLTAHLQLHKKDTSSRRGLLKLVAQRRKLLDYVKANSEERYQKLLQGLNLRK